MPLRDGVDGGRRLSGTTARMSSTAARGTQSDVLESEQRQVTPPKVQFKSEVGSEIEAIGGSAWPGRAKTILPREMPMSVTMPVM